MQRRVRFFSFAQMPLPSFGAMWYDPICSAEANRVKQELGGNLGGLTNLCCVRVSHALTTAGHRIRRSSDFKDKHGNPMIIRVVTMKEYLAQQFGAPSRVTLQSAAGKQGIIVFDVPFSNATGHCDLWNGRSCAFQAYWETATAVWLWQ